MILGGFDLGSRITGLCVGDGAGAPDVDAWDMPRIGNAAEGWDYGALLSAMNERLAILLARFPIEAVVYEAPIHIPKGSSRPYGDTLHKMRLLYPMGAFLEFVCAQRRIPCHEVAIADIKREVTGNPYAEKDDLVAIAQKCGIALPASDAARDGADAWGAWLLGLRHYDRLRSAEWDSRIWGGRGGLL